MPKYWEESVNYVKQHFKLQEAVLIKIPSSSSANSYNGSIGFIVGFEREWVLLRVSGDVKRFRGDEVLKLSI